MSILTRLFESDWTTGPISAQVRPMRWLAVFALFFLPQPLLAAWYKATSSHFIVYGEGSADSVRDYAEKLEKFEALLAARTGLETEADANRLIVFLVNGTDAVQKQMGVRGTNIAGFYSPRLWGTIAVVPRRSGGGGEYDLDSQTVLFHEYAHHFMLQNAPVAYPRWYSEGFAEYFSTTEFKPDGAVQFGYPAKHRFYGLAVLPVFPVQQLLVPDDRKMTDDRTEAFYGWSWLLTHYLNFEAKRKGQLDSYLKAFAGGTPPTDAAVKAFGPMDKLQKDLSAYRDARRMSYVEWRGFKPPDAGIAVVALSAPQNAAMAMYMRTYRPSNGKAEVDAAVAEARKLAARYPAEPMALDALAEFELDAEQYDAAKRANDAALATRPNDARLLMRAARIAITRLGTTGDDVQWKAVRSLIVKANRAAPNDPFPLWEFYRWHYRAGVAVPKTALDGLRRAVQLAPQVSDLRFALAGEELRGGEEATARRTLAPLLNDPHSAEVRQAAQALLDAKGRPTVDAPKPPESGAKAK